MPSVRQPFSGMTPVVFIFIETLDIIENKIISKFVNIKGSVNL